MWQTVSNAPAYLILAAGAVAVVLLVVGRDKDSFAMYTVGVTALLLSVFVVASSVIASDAAWEENQERFESAMNAKYGAEVVSWGAQDPFTAQEGKSIPNVGVVTPTDNVSCLAVIQGTPSDSMLICAGRELPARQ